MSKVIDVTKRIRRGVDLFRKRNAEHRKYEPEMDMYALDVFVSEDDVLELCDIKEALQAKNKDQADTITTLREENKRSKEVLVNCHKWLGGKILTPINSDSVVTGYAEKHNALVEEIEQALKGGRSGSQGNERDAEPVQG